MGRSTDKETRLSEQRKYRSWTAKQKIEIVLAGLRGDRTVKDVCQDEGSRGGFGVGGRQRQRAYYNALRDLAAHAMGHPPMIRIDAPVRDGAAAYYAHRERVLSLLHSARR